MVHFIENDHRVILALNDLLEVVVQDRQCRRTGARAETQQAPLGAGTQFRIIMRTGADVPGNPLGFAAVGPIGAGPGARSTMAWLPVGNFALVGWEWH